MGTRNGRVGIILNTIYNIWRLSRKCPMAWEFHVKTAKSWSTQPRKVQKNQGFACGSKHCILDMCPWPTSPKETGPNKNCWDSTTTFLDGCFWHVPIWEFPSSIYFSPRGGLVTYRLAVAQQMIHGNLDDHRTAGNRLVTMVINFHNWCYTIRLQPCLLTSSWDDHQRNSNEPVPCLLRVASDEPTLQSSSLSFFMRDSIMYSWTSKRNRNNGFIAFSKQAYLWAVQVQCVSLRTTIDR